MPRGAYEHPGYVDAPNPDYLGRQYCPKSSNNVHHHHYHHSYHRFAPFSCSASNFNASNGGSSRSSTSSTSNPQFPYFYHGRLYASANQSGELNQARIRHTHRTLFGSSTFRRDRGSRLASDVYGSSEFPSSPQHSPGYHEHDHIYDYHGYARSPSISSLTTDVSSIANSFDNVGISPGHCVETATRRRRRRRYHKLQNQSDLPCSANGGVQSAQQGNPLERYSRVSGRHDKGWSGLRGWSGIRGWWGRVNTDGLTGSSTTSSELSDMDERVREDRSDRSWAAKERQGRWRLGEFLRRW